MAAYDIHRHFKQLRVEPGRRKGRSDPFATGFEDDEDDIKRNTSSKRKPSPQTSIPVFKPQTPTTTTAEGKRRSSSPLVRQVDDSDDDDFSSYRPKRNINRRASPAPLNLQERPSRDPRALAVGNLAYLDDSEEETKQKRRDRRPSPAPGKRSSTSPPPTGGRSPSATRERSGSSIPRHTVASAFAGTKYLQDSDTDSDEEAVGSQRSGSQDSAADGSTSLLSPTEVKRVDKTRPSGSGVSWKSLQAGRTEQRNTELANLRQNLQKRGKSISFETHVITDDGQRIPLGQCCSNKGVRGRGRERSPPRLQQDTEPSKDENEEPTFTINPFSDQANSSDNEQTAIPTARPHQRISILTDAQAVPRANFQLSESLNHSPTSETTFSDSAVDSPDALSNSIDRLSKLAVGPQTIPEGNRIDHTLDNELSPTQSLSRTSSTGRFRAMSRFGSFSRRNSRRSGSNVSNSPAAAFLSSWHRESADEPADVKPDDEGQAIGLQGEYIIGRTISQGGFGVVKEIYTRNNKTGQEESYAVKIVRKQIHTDDYNNEKAQQDLEHEVSVWRHLQHPHILKLRMVFETEYATFCIMDLNTGPTLHDIIGKQRQEVSAKCLDAAVAKHYAYQLASALRYLHEDIKVCHRDVKLENCLVDNTGPDYDTRGGHLRLCDFGLADFLHSRSIDEERGEEFFATISRTTSSVIGTLEYASPKGLSVHRKLFETAGDVWAYGVIVYALCTGELPFKHTMPSRTVDAILRADWDSSALRLASNSGAGEEVYELVSGCLRKNIEDRWTISDCIESSWFDTVRGEEERKEQEQAWR